jgi:hypothetical protein
MTDETTITPRRTRIRREDRQPIVLPDGKTLEPRVRFAERVGISDYAARDMNLPTTYIGGVAYVPVEQSLEIIAGRAKRRNEPPARRRIASRR